MDIYNEVRKIFKEYGVDVDVIQLENNRKKFPEAGIMPETMNGHTVFTLRFNKTSLMRWALWEIIMHEVTHMKLKEMGYPKWKEHDDVFWATYAELRKKYEDKVKAIYGR